MTIQARLPGRDLVGYGRSVPLVRWPGDAKLALSIVLNYEEGSERSYELGDGVNEGLGEVPRGVVGDYRDLGTESVYEYGSRVGAHRMFRLFDRLGVPCTVFASAVALERNLTVAGAIAEAGHEVCAHGWRWLEQWRLSAEEERRQIDLAVVSIERTCGARPVGWYSRWMPSERTRELLASEGGFIYDSDAYNDDLPYYVTADSKPFLVVPYTLTYNDSRFAYGQAGSVAAFFGDCQQAVDYLCEEGESAPRMMSVGLHPRWTGQASRCAGLRHFLQEVQARGDVWIATRCAIAQWWQDHYPPEAVGIQPAQNV
jgi:peptidoglycan/xylan/chitin deacetylase (PgdA/CDA1 family)